MRLAVLFFTIVFSSKGLIWAQVRIELDDVLQGRVVFGGKSAAPIGEVRSGYVESVTLFKGTTSVQIKTADRDAFVYSRDPKYDDFISILSEELVPLRSIEHCDVQFFESISCQGDPREFVSWGEIRSGPFFRIRTFIVIAEVPKGFTMPIESMQSEHIIPSRNLEDQSAIIIGKLTVPLGTVVPCKCTIERGERNSVTVSTDQIQNLKIDISHVRFQKQGLPVDWTFVEPAELKEFDSVCYERIAGLGIPRSLHQFANSKETPKEFALSEFLVIKLPPDLELEGFDWK